MNQAKAAPETATVGTYVLSLLAEARGFDVADPDVQRSLRELAALDLSQPIGADSPAPRTPGQLAQGIVAFHLQEAGFSPVRV